MQIGARERWKQYSKFIIRRLAWIIKFKPNGEDYIIKEESAMGKLFYHYCSYEVFLSIIRSKCLWLTNIVKSNDSEEVKRIFEKTWRNLRKIILAKSGEISNTSDIVSILDEQMNIEIQVDPPYGICFSKNRDLVQNWVMYGNNCKGIAMGFSSDLFLGIKNATPHPNSLLENSLGFFDVVYDNSQVQKDIIEDAIWYLSNYNNALGWVGTRTLFKHVSSQLKNPSFIDEREVRLIYYPDKEHSDTLDLSSPTREDEHYNFPFINKQSICSLKEIIVGNSCEHTIIEIKRRLDDLGIKDVDVVPSECTYRSSANKSL